MTIVVPSLTFQGTTFETTGVIDLTKDDKPVSNVKFCDVKMIFETRKDENTDLKTKKDEKDDNINSNEKNGYTRPIAIPTTSDLNAEARMIANRAEKITKAAGDIKRLDELGAPDFYYGKIKLDETNPMHHVYGYDDSKNARYNPDSESEDSESEQEFNSEQESSESDSDHEFTQSLLQEFTKKLESMTPEQLKSEQQEFLKMLQECHDLDKEEKQKSVENKFSKEQKQFTDNVKSFEKQSGEKEVTGLGNALLSGAETDQNGKPQPSFLDYLPSWSELTDSVVNIPSTIAESVTETILGVETIEEEALVTDENDAKFMRKMERKIAKQLKKFEKQYGRERSSKEKRIALIESTFMSSNDFDMITTKEKDDLDGVIRLDGESSKTTMTESKTTKTDTRMTKEPTKAPLTFGRRGVYVELHEPESIKKPTTTKKGRHSTTTTTTKKGRDSEKDSTMTDDVCSTRASTKSSPSSPRIFSKNAVFSKNAFKKNSMKNHPSTHRMKSNENDLVFDDDYQRIVMSKKDDDVENRNDAESTTKKTKFFDKTARKSAKEFIKKLLSLVYRKCAYGREFSYECEYCGEKMWTEQECLQHGKEMGMSHTWIKAIRPCRGDHLVRWDFTSEDSSFQFPEHHAVCTYEESFLGPPMVAHFRPKDGLLHEDFVSFKSIVKNSSNSLFTVVEEKPVYIWPHTEGSRLSKTRSAERCLRMLGKTGYHGIYNNSEHFATWAVNGEKKSRQLWILGGGATAVSALWHIAGYVAAGPWGFAAAHGVFIVCKWTGLAYLGQDAAEHHWDSISRVIPGLQPIDQARKCCVCKRKEFEEKSKSKKKNQEEIYCKEILSDKGKKGLMKINKRKSIEGNLPGKKLMIKDQIPFKVEPFINCVHGACRDCLQKHIKNGGAMICLDPSCWEPLPPDLMLVINGSMA